MDPATRKAQRAQIFNAIENMDHSLQDNNYVYFVGKKTYGQGLTLNWDYTAGTGLNNWFNSLLVFADSVGDEVVVFILETPEGKFTELKITGTPIAKEVVEKIKLLAAI